MDSFISPGETVLHEHTPPVRRKVRRFTTYFAYKLTLFRSGVRKPCDNHRCEDEQGDETERCREAEQVVRDAPNYGCNTDANVVEQEEQAVCGTPALGRRVLDRDGLVDGKRHAEAQTVRNAREIEKGVACCISCCYLLGRHEHRAEHDAGERGCGMQPDGRRAVHEGSRREAYDDHRHSRYGVKQARVGNAQLGAEKRKENIGKVQQKKALCFLAFLKSKWWG